MSDAAAGRTVATTSSTDSGQGSGPLSDPFVAVEAGDVSTLGSVMRVEAPGGSSQLLVHRSSRVASSKSHLPWATASVSVSDVVVAPAGGRRKPRIPEPVLEETAPVAGFVLPAGSALGPRLHLSLVWPLAQVTSVRLQALLQEPVIVALLPSAWHQLPIFPQRTSTSQLAVVWRHLVQAIPPVIPLLYGLGWGALRMSRVPGRAHYFRPAPSPETLCWARRHPCSSKPPHLLNVDLTLFAPTMAA